LAVLAGEDVAADGLTSGVDFMKPFRPNLPDTS
jgi:hypothetical protein